MKPESLRTIIEPVWLYNKCTEQPYVDVYGNKRKRGYVLTVERAHGDHRHIWRETRPEIIAALVEIKYHDDWWPPGS